MSNGQPIEYDDVMQDYYGDEAVTALINLKVDTKDVDLIAARISKLKEVIDVFLVTGETDIIVKTRFRSYGRLKRFLLDNVSIIPGVKETHTVMVVTVFKENGELRIETPEEGA
jgi:DNA-binding Lrp family transcriptional regulator